MAAPQDGSTGATQGTGDGSAADRASRGVTRMLFDRLLLILSFGVVVGWLVQGLYWLRPGETAVVLRLGAYHRTRALEGLGFHWPPPLEYHRIENTGELRTEMFGEHPTRSTPGVPSDSEEGRVATGLTREAIQTIDHNVVYVNYELQYQIGDAYAFAFALADPASILHDAAEAAMRQVIGRREIDAVLSEQRGPIESEARTVLDHVLEGYGKAVALGPAFVVERINLAKPQAPDAVRDAFADVVSAGQDEKRSVLEAQGDAAEMLERARSESAEIRAQAEAYRSARVVEAKGEAIRFELLLAEYELAPEVTRRRLWLETMDTILPKMEKAIVERGAVNLWSSWPPARDGAGSTGAGPKEPDPTVRPPAVKTAAPAEGGKAR